MNKSYIDKVHYIRIPVRDLDVSAHWYRDVLGFQLVSITEDPYAIIKVNDGPLLLILVPTKGETYGHFTVDEEPAFNIGFTSPELADFHQYLMEHDVTVDDIKEDQGHAYFHFYDPSGNKLQVHW